MPRLGEPTLAGAAAWLGVRRTVLRRGIDGWEIAARWLGIALVLLSATLAVPVSGHIISAADERSAALHPTTATLLEDAVPVVWTDPVQATGEARVRATWRALDGSTAEGRVPVSPPAAAGDRVRVWLDAEGSVGPAPAAEGRLAVVSAMVALAVPGVGLVAASLWLAMVRRMLEPARQRYWALAWSSFNDAGSRPLP